ADLARPTGDLSGRGDLAIPPGADAASPDDASLPDDDGATPLDDAALPGDAGAPADLAATPPDLRPSSCTDSIQNGAESDVDCGDTCGIGHGCATGQRCLIGDDCLSHVCTVNACVAGAVFRAPAVFDAGPRPLFPVVADFNRDVRPGGER